MANEENTQRNDQDHVPTSGNLDNQKILAFLQELTARMTNVEEIILARLNTTRPFDEHQWTTQFDQLIVNVDGLVNNVAELRQEQTATRSEVSELRQEQTATRSEVAELRQEQTATRSEVAELRNEVAELWRGHEEFRAETNENFRLLNKQMQILSHTSLQRRAEHELLEERVTLLEDRAA